MEITLTRAEIVQIINTLDRIAIADQHPSHVDFLTKKQIAARAERTRDELLAKFDAADEAAIAAKEAVNG
jgi:hypothetical protein